MEKIKAGEFVRTKDGYIGKCQKIDVYYGDILIRTELKRIIYDFEVVKHSFNIIYLIRVGDYVNGCKILDIDFKNEMICLLMPFNEENKSKYNIVWNTKYFIKSIVTKEQFERMEYMIKEA